MNKRSERDSYGRIYVASSWRNEHQPSVVKFLRETGFTVYDFRHPLPANNGFHWSEIDPEWKEWDFSSYREGLKHPLAESGFELDMGALKTCDACILVLPCGRSAHLELGWASGAGKHTAIYNPPGVQVEPELMSKMVHFITDNTDELLQWLIGKVAPPVMTSYFGHEEPR